MVFLTISLSAVAQNKAIKEIAGSPLTSHQYYNLLLAKATVDHYCKVDCKNLTLLVLGIEWQESHAGLYGPVGDIQNGFGKRSYGLMQIKLLAANKILQLHPNLKHEYFQNRPITYDELIARLILDNQFNVTVGMYYLEYLHDRFHLSWDEAVRAYNQGIVNRWNYKAHTYLKDVVKIASTHEIKKIVSRP